jgi:hypothetical protein
MKFRSDSFPDGGAIPGEFAFCVIDPAAHVKLSNNRNPHFAWSDLPAGTRSLALICHDPDVPSRGDDVNQESKTVPADLPRVDFFHWSLIDIPPQVSAIPAGALSNGVVARGKPGPAVQSSDFGSLRHGLNDYTGWFAGDADMKGDYFGYDGPCPPWNDAIVHRYIFTLYALDVDKLAVDGKFTGQQARQALQGHILAQAQWMGKYSLNPAVKM